MKNIIILSQIIILFSACEVNKKSTTEKQKEGVTIELASFEKIGEHLDLNFAIANFTQEPISIIRPYGVDKKEPEFFKLQLFYDGNPCFYDISVYMEELKDQSDILTINPKETIKVKIDPNDFREGFCDENIKEIKAVLKYVPDQSLFEQKKFMRQFSNVNGKESFYEVFKSTYRQVVKSDTISVNLTSNQ